MPGFNYGRVAAVYETLGYIYSGRQIYDAKASQIGEMKPLDRVLYVGIGPGEDALLAAQIGASVTGLDLSVSMLKLAEDRMTNAGCKAEFLCADITQHDRTGFYDVVVVNFFLNVFKEEQMRQMLNHVATLVKPGGKLLISDFMCPRGNAAARAAQSLYWRVTNLFYYLIGLIAWHPVYDYPAYFAEAEVELVSIREFRPWGISPVGFSSITATRPIKKLTAISIPISAAG